MCGAFVIMVITAYLRKVRVICSTNYKRPVMAIIDHLGALQISLETI